MAGLLQPLVNLAGGFLGQTDAAYGAKTQGAKANTYGNQAAQGYQSLQQQAGLFGTPAAYNLQNLYASLANANGLNWSTGWGNSTPTSQSGTPGQVNLGTAQQGRGNAADLYKALGAFGQSQLGNYSGQIGGAQNAFLNASNMGGGGASPYALNQNQGVELNGQLDQIAQAHKAAERQLEQTFSRSGLSSPGAIAAGKAQLAEHFGGLGEQARASFTENARQQQVQQAQQYLQFLQAQAGQGANALGGGASGLESVAGGAQGAGQFDVTNANQQKAMHNAALMDLINSLIGQQQFGTQTYAQGTSGLGNLAVNAQQSANLYNTQARQDLSGLLGTILEATGVTGKSNNKK